MEPKLHLERKPCLKLYLKSGAKIVIELWPETAPNAVNSLIYVAAHGMRFSALRPASGWI